MADLRKHSSISNVLRVVLKRSDTGQGLTGLTEASAGLIISTIADNEAATTRYRASSSEIETIATLGTFAAPSSSKCRFKEIDATNHPGLYEIQIADARFSVASAKRMVVSWSGATTLLAGDYEIQLVQVDPYDAVRFGLTALPNAAAEAAGGLYTRGTGAGQIRQDANGRIDSNVKAYGDSAGTFASGRPEVNTSHLAGSAVDQTGGLINANVKQLSGDATAADNAEAFFDGTGYAGTGNTIPTVTTLTNAPSDSSGVTTLLSRLSALRAGYLDNLSAGAVATAAKLLSYFQSALRKDVTVDADIGGNYDDATDSQEALRDRGDAAWATATSVAVSDKTGFSLTSAYDPAKTASQAGDAMTLTSGERTTLAAAIWDRLTSALTTVGSIGKLLVDNINATISSRLASASYTAPLDAAGTRSAVGLASANLDTQLSTITGYIDTEVAAIKAKTDNLPAAPASVGDIPTAVQNADALLGRTIGGGANGGRMVKDALRFNRNKFTIAGGTLTVYEEDDTTIAWTATITQTAGNPVSASDPA